MFAHVQFSPPATLPTPTLYSKWAYVLRMIRIPGSPSFLVCVEKTGETGDKANFNVQGAVRLASHH